MFQLLGGLVKGQTDDRKVNDTVTQMTVVVVDRTIWRKNEQFRDLFNCCSPLQVSIIHVHQEVVSGHEHTISSLSSNAFTAYGLSDCEPLEEAESSLLF